MASATTAALEATWADLKANPVFRRSTLPRGLRGFVRSPFPRALLLTMAAVAVFVRIERTTLVIWPVLAAAVLFWFLIRAMQHYFGWLELTALAKSGTLDDYLNSGLSRADVAIGVIYPAELSERIATFGVLVWFLLTTDDTTVRIVLIVFAFLQAQHILRPPSLFLPDVESYLRKRNPVALFFISIGVAVPIVVWFAIYFTLFFGLIFGAPLVGLRVSGNVLYIGAIVGTYLLSQPPIRWWNTWRLRRFYSRYGSFEDLFERFVENG